MGSNGIRFLAVEALDADAPAVLSRIRVPVRLGHDAFTTGELSDDAIDAACEAFQAFAEDIAKLEIARYRAVATSAVRDSRNGSRLVERARLEAGLTIETITGAEEARLVHLAVRNRVALGKEKWLVADLGGGSVEVSIADDRGIDSTVTHPMGSVRLIEELDAAGMAPERFKERLDAYAAALQASGILESKTAGYIATGGNIEALAKLASATPDERGVATLPIATLREWIERLADLTYEDRVAALRLRPDRADVILPAAMVYERIGTLAGADVVIVPNAGVKDGVILDLLR